MHGALDIECLAGDRYANTTQLFEELHRLQRVWSAYKPAADVRKSEFFVLMMIWHVSQKDPEPLTVGKLARHMHQSLPGISQKLGELEKRGLLQRIADENDRRMVTLELTPYGEEQAKAETTRMMGKMEHAMERLGPEKTQELISGLQQLADVINDELEQDKK